MQALIVVTNIDRLPDTGEESGFHLSEVTHPLAELSAAGVEVDLASPRGGRAPITAADRDDPVNAAFLDDAEWMRRVAETLGPDEVRAEAYDALLFAGGHGTMWDFPRAAWLGDVAARIYDSGGVVAAVCHGPAALLATRLADGRPIVAGKRVAAFTNDEERAVRREGIIPFFLADALIDQGAQHVPVPEWQANVVVDERLVTGQNPASAAGVGRAMVELLRAGATARPTA
jgi:putative intracellular protease/amidase